MRPGFAAGKQVQGTSLLKYSLSPADSCDRGRPTGTHRERPKLGIEISRMLQRPSLEFMARNCLRPAVARARLERVPGAARLTLQMSENPIDDSGIGDDGDNLHLCAADNGLSLAWFTRYHPVYFSHLPFVYSESAGLRFAGPTRVVTDC